MAGIDTIVLEIRKESDQAAAAVVAAAEKEAQAILEAAKNTAAEQAAKLRRENEKKEADLKSRSASQMDLRRRQSMLAKKQELIAAALTAAIEKVNAMPAEEYFAAVAKIAAKAAHAGEQGQIAFSAADLARLPEGFEASLADLLPEGAKLCVSKAPVSIKNGAVLLYDGIEENCSFEEIALSRKDDLQDAIKKILFD